MKVITQSFIPYFGDNLESLYRYGYHSATTANINDINLLAVVRDVSALKPTYKSPWFRRAQSIQVFTQSELQNALDVFPLEFLEMNLDRELLFGSDPLATMTVSVENVRHQVEYVLRTVLLRQRSSLILAPKFQRATALQSFEDIIRSLRGLISINKGVYLGKADDVLRSVEDWKGCSLSSLRQMLLGNTRRMDLNEFCRELESLVAWIDEL